MRASIVMLLIAARAHGDPVRVDAGITGSTALDDRSGTGFVVEIKGRAREHLAIGGRVELAVMFGGHVASADLPFGMSACGLVKAEYDAGRGAVRPFAGLGAGVYAASAYTIDGGDISSTTGHYVGVAPELGVDLGRVRVAATYNAILGTSVEYRAGAQRATYSPSYLSLELSFRFGTR